MQKIKLCLESKGWDVSTCIWEVLPTRNDKKHLECYIIKNETESKSIILQQFLDGSVTIYSIDKDLLK